MKHTLTLLAVIVGLMGVSGCSEKDPPIGPRSFGAIDPTAYVAIGNSISSGYQSGALFASAQEYSFPNLIAQQLGSSFVQPIMPDPGTGSLITLKSLSPSVVLEAGASNAVVPTNATTHLRPYNNLGIPNCVMVQCIDSSDFAARSNPFFRLILRDRSFGASQLKQAVNLQPTVMTFWLGNNDALIYAITGGTRGTNLGLDGKAPFSLPTESIVIRNSLAYIFGTIKAALPNTKVVVGNIPSIKNIPFFSTVPRKIPNPQNPSQLLSIYYRAKDNSVKTVGDHDYVILSAQSKLSKGVGLLPNLPLGDEDVLEESEAANVDAAVDEYNKEIQDAVAAAGANFALVDFHAVFEELRMKGRMIAGERFTADFISGGVFSLDGIHPSNKGAGIVANEFIHVMNSKFGANIPYVEISRLPGLKAPLAKRSNGFLPPIIMDESVARAMLGPQ